MSSAGADPREIVQRALAEDLGSEDLAVALDVTSALSLPSAQRGRGEIRAKSAGVLAGVECAALAFRLLDAQVTFEAKMQDGAAMAPGDCVVRFEGAMAPLLAYNF